MAYECFLATISPKNYNFGLPCFMTNIILLYLRADV